MFVVIYAAPKNKVVLYVYCISYYITFFLALGLHLTSQYLSNSHFFSNSKSTKKLVNLRSVKQ